MPGFFMNSEQAGMPWFVDGNKRNIAYLFILYLCSCGPQHALQFIVNQKKHLLYGQR